MGVVDQEASPTVGLDKLATIRNLVGIRGLLTVRKTASGMEKPGGSGILRNTEKRIFAQKSGLLRRSVRLTVTIC